MNNRIVLLIEDNAMNMELASDLLETAGCHVLKADRAKEGIALAVAQQPDIILMDLALPGMDGWEATRRLKQDVRTAWIPVVALTASVMRGDDNRARSAGCCGYIAKPIDTRHFVKTVAGFMGRERKPVNETA
ncbi:response regulator [Candidatus Sumerlaeota bacterium]|nr:response regulator [Candidatus Sumerlaeota bacterium]